MATPSPKILTTSGGSKTGTSAGGGINWGSIISTYGPAALELFQAYSANRASNDATDERVDAIGDAGQLQYQTALQAMELARQRDMQTRLDTEQSRFGGYNAMRTIARQLGLPVYDQPFNGRWIRSGQGREVEWVSAAAPGRSPPVASPEAAASRSASGTTSSGRGIRVLGRARHLEPQLEHPSDPHSVQ